MCSIRLVQAMEFLARKVNCYSSNHRIKISHSTLKTIVATLQLINVSLGRDCVSKCCLSICLGGSVCCNCHLEGSA